MLVEFLVSFNNDLDKITVKSVKKSIVRIIECIENANTPFEIPNIKKLTGHKAANRIRTGDYRIGVFIEHDKVEFIRIAHRKDIYNIFP